MYLLHEIRLSEKFYSPSFDPIKKPSRGIVPTINISIPTRGVNNQTFFRMGEIICTKVATAK
jgi:hypothetical protein